MGAAVLPERIVRPAPPAAERDAYTYGVTFLPLAAGQTDTQDIAIQSDHDFFTTWMAGTVGTTDLVFTDAPPLLVTIKGSGSGEEWSDEAVHWLAYFGRGGARDFFPFRFIPERRMSRSSTVKVTVQNLDAGTAFRIRIFFHGYKRYVVGEG